MSRYVWLLLLAVWVTLPYLGIFFTARRAIPDKVREFLVFMGALIILAGGLAAYVDVLCLRPDPQGGLAFVAVPLYQMIIVGFLAVLQLLVKKR